MNTQRPRQGQIEISGGGIQFDAAMIADAFALDPATVPGLMRDGRITSKCERGEGEDAGKYRVTFWYGDRALRLTIDEAGNLLSRGSFPVQRKPRVQSA